MLWGLYTYPVGFGVWLVIFAVAWVGQFVGHHIEAKKSSTSVAVGIGQKTDGAFGLDLDITITVEGVSTDDAEKWIKKAHEVCPYSNAVRGNAEVRLHVNVIETFDL